MKIFYFTATGNCLDVAKRFECELISIPNILKRSEKQEITFKDDKIGIIFPCYVLIAPKIIREFIDKVKLNSDYIFAIMTYGNFPGDGINWFVKYCDKRDIKISYANDLLMIDNYLPIFDIQKQIEKEPEKKIEEQIEKIKKDIFDSKKIIVKHGFLNKLASGILQYFYDFLLVNGYKKFIVNSGCNRCGICQQVCPRNNIVIKNKSEIGNKCEFCLACINLCPQKAIIYKNEKNPDYRFKNRNVSLKEIINSNN
ncbi:EFR1 family ferrodoxin [Candidatus Dependentiae bacterium]|nr:EFR1 family ferrodoxin [Candidatus Dependentiae bacterium]